MEEKASSSVAQRKRVGLITQRSEDRNLVELDLFCSILESQYLQPVRIALYKSEDRNPYGRYDHLLPRYLPKAIQVVLHFWLHHGTTP